MRTIIYVDGFNLYYATLTKSAHKWLDIHELFSRKVVKTIQPTSSVIRIKYFTSPILGKFSSDPKSPDRQMRYHNALLSRHPELIEIVSGYHTQKETNAYREKPANGSERIKVYVMEEKQTDVNISLHMYRDAALNNVDQQVLVSNDSDLAPALEMIRNDFSGVKIGLIIPVLSDKARSRKSGKLQSLAHWTRDYLRAEELVDSQMPLNVPNRKGKAIKKPDEW